MKTIVCNTTLVLAVLAANLFSFASAQNLADDLKKKAGECRNARHACFQTCYVPSKKLEVGQEVLEGDIEACQLAYAEFKSGQGSTMPEPTWTPEYEPMPDVVGVFRGAVIQAQERDDWKRYCRSTALLSEGSELALADIPKGATVRVTGIQYVTNPVRSFDRSKNACLAESVKLISVP